MTGLFSVLLVILICFVIFCCWCMIWDSNRFVVRKYYLQTEKLEEEVRFLFLSDLHNKEYGPGNVRLLEEIQKQNKNILSEIKSETEQTIAAVVRKIKKEFFY